MYVLERGDILGSGLYYSESWIDTLDISKAKKYTLDDALAESRMLKKIGMYYKVIRVPD